MTAEEVWRAVSEQYATLNRSTGVTCLANPSTWLRYSSGNCVPR